MTVRMDVSKVREAGNGLRGFAPGVRGASKRVEGPAAAAKTANSGFATAEAGERWREAFSAVVDSVERRQDWQGEQVVGCADAAESTDDQISRGLNTIGGQIPAADV